MALLLFTMPSLMLAQQTNDAYQAIIDAQKDADTEQQFMIWGAAAVGTATLFGCLGGSVILGASFVHEPKPPIERLIGKSPEYITFYTKTYRETVRKSNQKAALGGCIGGSLLAGLIWSQFYQHYY